MNHSRIRFGRLLVAPLAITLASGVIASSTAFASTSARAIPVPAKNAAAAKLVPKATAAKGSISFGEDATYAPDEFVAADGKTLIGMDVDLANAIASVLGLKAKIVNATFDTIIPGIQSGKYDVGMSSFTINADRQKVVNFVSYFQAGEGYYVKASSSLKLSGLNSLCGLKVSVESGTTEESDAQATSKTCTKAGKKAVTVQSYSDQNAANLAVSSGRADLGFADSQVAAYIAQQSKGTFKVDGSAFEVAPYGIAFSKTSTLDKATLAAVKVLIADGIYKKILAKWGISSGAITKPAIS